MGRELLASAVSVGPPFVPTIGATIRTAADGFRSTRKSATSNVRTIDHLPHASTEGLIPHYLVGDAACLLADNVYQNLVGIADPGERKRRIIAAASMT